MATRRSGRLLVEADHIARGIAEPSADLRRILADRLHDLPPSRRHGVEGGGNVVYHHVDHEAGCGRGRPSRDPCSAHLSHAVIEGRRAVAALTSLPAEDVAIEL